MGFRYRVSGFGDSTTVIPAKAGISGLGANSQEIPASAGMTVLA